MTTVRVGASVARAGLLAAVSLLAACGPAEPDIVPRPAQLELAGRTLVL